MTLSFILLYLYIELNLFKRNVYCRVNTASPNSLYRYGLFFFSICKSSHYPPLQHLMSEWANTKSSSQKNIGGGPTHYWTPWFWASMSPSAQSANWIYIIQAGLWHSTWSGLYALVYYVSIFFFLFFTSENVQLITRMLNVFIQNK